MSPVRMNTLGIVFPMSCSFSGDTLCDEAAAVCESIPVSVCLRWIAVKRRRSYGILSLIMSSHLPMALHTPLATSRFVFPSLLISDSSFSQLPGYNMGKTASILRSSLPANVILREWISIEQTLSDCRGTHIARLDMPDHCHFD